MAKRVGEKNTKDVSTAMAAIRGEMPDATGETYGVVGTSNSPEGAGLGAVNTAGGPDLVLDGVEDGESDTLVSQSGIRRSSAGRRGLHLREHRWRRHAPRGDRLTIHGNGGGLVDVDAETLDGIDSSAFSPLAHLHDDRYYTESELNTSGGGGSVHWDNLGLDPAGFADGDDDTTYTAGTGLILSGTEFRTSIADSALTPSDNSLSVLDDTGLFETHLTMTVGSDGLGLVAYFDNSPSKLKVAHCDDLRCASAGVATISGTGEVDMVGGLVVGSDGLGLIVYHDVTDDLAVEIGHCNDIPCSSVSASVIDSLPGNVSSMPSMALGSDGYGLVAYYDGDPGDENLNVAHCENATCTQRNYHRARYDRNGGLVSLGGYRIGRPRTHQLLRTIYEPSQGGALRGRGVYDRHHNRSGLLRQIPLGDDRIRRDGSDQLYRPFELSPKGGSL